MEDSGLVLDSAWAFCEVAGILKWKLQTLNAWFLWNYDKKDSWYK